MIIIYLAVAGACAEQEANAGGGSPPAGITLNQVYFSDSSTSGAGAGAIVKIFRNSFIFGVGSGIGTDITGLTQNVAVSALSTTHTKSTYTLPATNLSSFFTSAASAGEQVFLNLATFLQAPNGLSSVQSYSVSSVATTSSGVSMFNEGTLFGAELKGASYPLQNSLTIGNTYPAAGLSSNWGIMGTGALGSTFGGVAGTVVNITTLFDNSARGGSINAGDTMTIVYAAKAVNSSGVTEVSSHTVEITLT